MFVQEAFKHEQVPITLSWTVSASITVKPNLIAKVKSKLKKQLKQRSTKIILENGQ